jgi:membrane-associated phospholipid phosphatase
MDVNAPCSWIFLWPLLLLFAAPVARSASSTEKAGDALFVLVPVTGFATAYLKHDKDGQIQFAKAFATNAVVTLGLKAAVNKQRPNGDCCDSFPSGHTSFAFMGATFLQKRYGRNYGVPAFAAATYVAYSRVESDKHFVADVVAGAALGIFSSYFFTTRFPDLTVTPVAGNDYAGIAFNMQW